MSKKPTQKYYITPKEAKARQLKLRERIKIQPFQGELHTAAGADISFNRGSNVLHAGFVTLRLPDLKVISRSLASKTVNFPYIPGLLSFREIPALLKAWEQLEVKPDVVILDGHGLAHPRRMGIATQFGITVDHPTMGCAKNILVGHHDKLKAAKGSFQYIEADKSNEKIGIVYRSRNKVKPIFISPGHKVSFADCRAIIEQCLTKFKLPETTRQAHMAVNKLRRGELEAGYWENPEL
jgi:deoxyribonuclease V